MGHDRTDRLLTDPIEIFYYWYRTTENIYQRLFGTVRVICIKVVKTNELLENIDVFVK